MKRRKCEFRPSAFDRLEDRVVMSHATVAQVASVSVRAAGSALKVGTLGDSFTDEYKFYTPDRNQARNWVEILSATRGVNFGAFSNSRRAEPRNAGFASNWARSDATTDDMVRNQLPGLADQVRKGKVNTAWVFIGGNDYIHYLENLNSPFGTNTDAVVAGLKKVESNAEDNITTAVKTLLMASPDVKIVLVTVPDVSLLPALAPFRNLPQSQPIFDAVSASLNNYNARIKTLAAGEPRVAVADLASQYASVAQQANTTGFVDVGGTKIDVKTPGDSYNHFFLNDGVHIGTVAQGLLANLFVQTVDGQFGQKVKPLSATEILKVARHLPAR